MYEFIQALPHNPIFILILIGITGFAWFGLPKTKWWKKHIVADFAESGHHPACFMCNHGNESCYKIWNNCEAWRIQHNEHLKKAYQK